MIQLRDNYWAVEVADPQHAVISGNTITWSANGAQGRGFIALPPGDWQIVCTSKGVTRMQAREIVERTHEGGFGRSSEEYRHYKNNGVCFDPLYSLNTLLTSKGCDLNKNWLILKND